MRTARHTEMDRRERLGKKTPPSVIRTFSWPLRQRQRLRDRSEKPKDTFARAISNSSIANFATRKPATKPSDKSLGKLSRKQWNIRNFCASIMKRKHANYWIAHKPLKLERRNIPLTWDGKSTVQGPEEPRHKKQDGNQVTKMVHYMY